VRRSGSHTLTAVATGALGNTATSAPSAVDSTLWAQLMGDHVPAKKLLAVGVITTMVLLGVSSQSNRVRSIGLLAPSISGFVEVAPRRTRRPLSARQRARS